MTKEYIEKWNNYTIGKVPFINRKRNHPHRLCFVIHAIKNHYNSIVEIGAGECIEAQRILEFKPETDYTIVDISDTFLDYAKSLNINTIKGEMNNTGISIPNKQSKFDCVYMSGVLEHSPDIHSTLLELKRISKEFYISMFKWKYETGGTESEYREEEKYYSTEYNIYKLLKLIESCAVITELNVISKGGNVTDFKDYYPYKDSNNNNTYLSIAGRWK